MRFRFVVPMLATFLAPTVFAQASPDAAAILSRSADELQRYRSYQITEDTATAVNMPGASFAGAGMPGITMTSLTQALNPGKVHMEMKAAGIVSTIMVADGNQVWIYVPFMHQYSKLPSDSAGDVGSAGMAAVADMKDLAGTAKITGSETLEVDGQPHDCWIVEARAEKPASAGGAGMQNIAYTFWIDKTLGIQLKMTMTGKVQTAAAAQPIETRTTMTVHSIKFNLDFPDSLFVFTPPADAKETAELFGGAIAGLGEKSPVAAKTSESKTAAAGEPEVFIPMLAPIDRVEPEYPAAAREQKLQGDVELLITIDPSGAVVDAEPLTGREILRPAAIEAVKQWKYRPVYRDGRPVSAYTQAIVVFYLEKLNGPEDLGFDMAEQMKMTQRIQEMTSRFPRSPQQVLADSEDQIRGRAGEDRLVALSSLPKEALDAGALDKASSYANELLQVAKDSKDSFDYGGGMYTANMVLGLVALRQGNVAEARRYLLESGKTPGSPLLNSFGPDLTLARELLAKGERDSVLEFLKLCKNFWTMGSDQLDAMAAEVSKGGTF